MHEQDHNYDPESQPYHEDDHDDNNNDDDNNQHQILVHNHFRHIPGPAGEIFISDDHLNNQQLYQQQFTQIQQNRQRQQQQQQQLQNVKKSTSSQSGNNNNLVSKEKKLQEEYERNLRVSLERFLVDNGQWVGSLSLQQCTVHEDTASAL